MKPHEFRELVNELRDTAVKYHDHQSLRERIAHVLRAHEVFPDAQPTQGAPDGWLRAIDEALVVAHLGVAETEDGYEEARRKLNELICWHVTVATDPAVNGGWKLMPVEPTKEIYECFSAYDGTSYSNPFDFDDFSVDYAFALEAAPEFKP